MFACCCRSKKKELKPPEYVEPSKKSKVELVKYEKVIGELSDTSYEPVLSPTPTPPPRDRISFLANEKEDNSSENDSMFNISVNHSILSERIGSFRSRNVRILKGNEQNVDELYNGDKIEPLFTINISVKNERNGVLIHRKIYL